jgi:hypothetical protein
MARRAARGWLARDGLVRGGMALLALVNLCWGVWAVVWPRHFVDEFPGFGHRWTAAYPPYNEHLVTDLGSTFLTLAVLLAVAAALHDRRARALALSGVLVFNALHLGFHATHRGAMSTFDAGASIVALVAGVLLPLALLVLDLLGGRFLSRRGGGLGDGRARPRDPHDRRGQV